MLDEEGPVYLFDDIGKKFRYSAEQLKKIDNFFIFGEKDLSNLNKKFYLYENRLKITGHPKFDILKNPYNKVFKRVRLYKK